MEYSPLTYEHTHTLPQLFVSLQLPHSLLCSSVPPPVLPSGLIQTVLLLFLALGRGGGGNHQEGLITLNHRGSTAFIFSLLALPP